MGCRFMKASKYQQGKQLLKHAAKLMYRRWLQASGQSTVEYALVVSGFLVVFLAMGLMHHAINSGLFVEHALMSASHVITNVSDGVLRDVFLV